MTATARIALEDGTVLEGRSVGAAGEHGGDLVFNTAMTGYHEILTDPSYAGQVVLMTYPLIGNYGVAEEDAESERAWVEGFVVKELSAIASNFRSNKPLGQWLKEHSTCPMCRRTVLEECDDINESQAGLAELDWQLAIPLCGS